MTYITRLTLQGFKSFNKKVSIPFINGFNIICGPNGSGKCVRGDTLVILADGSLREIKDIVEESFKNSTKIEKLKDGFICYENPLNFEVLTLNPMSLKIEKQEIKAFVKRKSPEFLFKIKTRTGKEIVTTHFHPFFTIENGVVCTISAEKLSKGMKIATPRILPVENGDFSINLLENISPEDNLYVEYSQEIENMIDTLKEKFGSYKKAAEKLEIPYNALRGVKNKQAINVAYLRKILKSNGIEESFIKFVRSKNANIKVKLQHKFTEELARFLGYLVSEGSSLKLTDQIRFTNEDPNLLDDFINLSENLWGLRVGKGNYKLKTIDLMLYSKPLQKLLDRAFKLRIGSDASKKVVPPQVFTAPTNIIANFLAAIIDGDGYICAKMDETGKHEIYLEYSTRSKSLAYGISTLLLRLGIVSLVKEKKRRINKQKKYKKYYYVIVYGIENLQKLKNLLPLKSKVKREALERLANWKIKPNPNIDLVPDVNNLIKRAVRSLGINIKKVRKTCPKLQAYYENRCEASRNGLNEVAQFLIDNFSLNLEAQNLLKALILLANSDIFWDEVVEIRKIKGEKWVYDLCIEGYHNFIANNFIIHNSNLVDSICFVLGRISAKSMRADRLTELIFHGSEKKKPAEYASVTLYLDNSKKVFPYDEEEISITRKVNRSGTSIYKINGRTVTREKVLQLLSAARIKPDGHNIILQGDVTNIIEMNPVERRGIIDEISGIAEYNDKKEKAMRDLDSVEQRLKEAEIIISQRYEIFKKLQAERNAALRYQKLQKDLKILKASYLNKLIQIKAEKHSKLEEKIQDLKEKYEKAKNEMERIEKELEEKENSTREIVRKLIEISKGVKIEKEVSELRSDILIKREKIESNLREIERIDSIIEKLESIERKKAELKGEIPNAVRAILRLNLRGVYGTVENLISVPQEYKIAIDVAAGPHLFDLVVENDEIAEFCINYLKREKIGRATFLPLNKINPNIFKDFSLLKEPGIIGVASKFIKFDPKFMRAIEFVFGNTLLAKDLESARRLIGKARIVTLEGELIERSGAIVGGYYFKSPEKIETEKEIENYRAMKKRLSEEVEIFKEELKQLEEKLGKLKVEETTKKLIDLEKLKISSEKEIDELREKRGKLQNRLVNLEIETNQIKIEQAKIEAELESLKNEISQYDVTHYVDEKLSDLSNFIKKAEKELQDLGLVNLRAIEEYEKFKSEFESYKEKYEKILEEKKAVLKMIEEIEEKRKEVFYKCLNEISNHFNSIFLKMFKGTASLELEDPNNLESGLLIKANPRGKTVLNIDSMSGGEKALTALTFLFAIQKYKPAPFYVLDEIDAALDKENIAKLGELIKSFSKNEQFIIITHNDQTVRYGDRVYGVTMSEGESKILGLELPA